MTLLFDRKYKLTVGLPSLDVENIRKSLSILSEGITPFKFSSSEDWRTLISKRAVEITDLNIVADIKGTSNSTSSSTNTTIKIYNMCPETITIVAQTNNYVILEAGYAQDGKLPMLFSGQVQSHSTVKEGRDLITTLVCKDGYTPNNYVKISKKFDKEDTYGDVLTYLVAQYNSIGIATGDYIVDWADVTDRKVDTPYSLTSNDGKVLAQSSAILEYPNIPAMIARPSNSKLKTGLVLMGFLHQALDKVCSQLGYVNYITNGRLFVHPKGYTKMIEQFEFSSKLMKSIRPVGSKVTGGSGSKGVEGVTITTFLDGRLDTDKSIKILDGKYKGVYKIITKSHKLEYRGAGWDTVVMCTKYT